MNRPTEGRSAGGGRRIVRAIGVSVGAALGLTLIAPNAKALTINVFTQGFTAAEQARINDAVNFYQTTFSDPITVNIGIMAVANGLGESQTYVTTPTYAAYKAALAADATSADDATALASLGPGTATDPEGHSTRVTLKTANARAVGIAGAPAGGASSALFCNAIAGLPALIDACIGINNSLTSATPNTAGKYYFLSVLEHEMDEVLGLGSDLNGDGTNFTANLAAQDLFRFSAPGVRTFAHHTCDASFHGPLAYFSIDNGVTNASSFNNCDNGGDYGDYVYQDSPPQVQDAFGTPGLGLALTAGSSEAQELDVLGYTRAAAVTPAPEPATLTLVASGFLGIAGFARRRRAGKLVMPA